MFKLIIVLVCLITTIIAYDEPYDPADQIPWWDTDDYNEPSAMNTKPVPFPQCLSTGSKSNYLQSSSLQKLFSKALSDVEDGANYEHMENYKKKNYDTMDYSSNDYGYDDGKSRQAATAAIRLTKAIMTKLACNLTGIDPTNIASVLSQIAVPGEFCTIGQQLDCTGKLQFRVPNGTCNNPDSPFDGSAQTAFARLQPAQYDDGISEPRRKAYYGGYLPACRKISLALGSKPVFDRTYNNLYVSFGQFVAHDVSLSVPVSDTYATPVTTCTCSSKYDWNKCTVIDIQPDDPYLRWQKCMAFPATAQAFKGQICTLGAKEQLNGNTHFVDLSNLYGTTIRMATALRSVNGTLKSTRRSWFRYELPPAQREGKSCIDATYDKKCFAGGDSRVMIHLLFTGIQTMFLRAHNKLAKIMFQDITNNQLAVNFGEDLIYETVKKLLIAYFQKVTYFDWLPILLGSSTFTTNFGTLFTNTNYNQSAKPIITNEFATAAFRLHTLVRDLFSRATVDGKRIDQLWLHDILLKVKYAYDIQNNGIDSLLTGALYDFGFAYDGNFAHQIHHRLFESTSPYGQIWRNDLVAINICRGREHGIGGYNTYRQYCNLTKAYYFEDFLDTINYDGIKLLRKLYKHVDDVDLFVALNLEDPVQGGLLGPVSVCIITQQFLALRDGDRFFFSHNPTLSVDGESIVGLPTTDFGFVSSLSLQCFMCETVDVDQVPPNPFKPPVNGNLPQSCGLCDGQLSTLLNGWRQRNGIPTVLG